VAAGAGLKQWVGGARSSPPGKEHGKGVSARRDKSVHLPSKGIKAHLPALWQTQQQGATGRRRTAAFRPGEAAPSALRASARDRRCSLRRVRALGTPRRAARGPPPAGGCTTCLLVRSRLRGAACWAAAAGRLRAAARQPATQQRPPAPAAPCVVRAAAQAELPAAGCFLWPTGVGQGGRAVRSELVLPSRRGPGEAAAWHTEAQCRRPCCALVL
jgi:hypothetical protein